VKTLSPLISIIIPTFNSEKSIRKCIDSIVVQQNSCFEVIIQDCVSTDNTQKIIQEYKNIYSYIKFYSIPDDGIYDAMNKGILKSKGTWLLFLGSDDFLIDKDVVSELEKTISACLQAKMIHGDVLSKSLGRKTGGRYGGEFDMQRIIRQNICHQSILYKSEIFENGLYNTRYKVYADYVLNLKLILDSYIVKVHVPLLISHFSDGGFSSNRSDSIFDNEFSSIVCKYTQTSFHLYQSKFRFLSAFFHKINKQNGLGESFRVIKTSFKSFKRYSYSAFLFSASRYLLGLYFLRRK
jgi:glycosyltransferase involved in cell wall biosynthesis